MSSPRDIRGAGGGGGKGGGSSTPRTPVEAPDSLHSTSYARILDLIGEGEIEGLVDGLLSIYLDGVPIQNEDGTTNFRDVQVDVRTGTQGQSYIPLFAETETDHTVNVEVKAATPIIRTVTTATVDRVRVRIAIPGLSSQNTTTGDLTGASVTIAIDVQSNGGGYVAQPLGRTFSSSPNPAVQASDALQLFVQWNRTRGSTRVTVTYQVQYRQVGAGSWTTIHTDFMDSGAWGARSFMRLSHELFPDEKRVYTVTGLANLIYEARVVKTSGEGTLTLSALFIGVPAFADVITGKTTTTYIRPYEIALTGSPPWDIRVRRLTADSGSASLRNKTYFDGYTEIVSERLRYPNSALIGLRVDASQFSTVPVRGYDVKLLRVKIPSNYDPITRVYTGVWDGTFTVAWTDNPAWCFYDLVTNARYGLGASLSAAQVDKWGLYAIGKYCDELVPDGFGHQEPRFTCNLYLQTRDDAFRVLTAMASIFRGMVYWAAGAITAVQDAPHDPVCLFTEANVEDGLFTYSGTARAARHTAALVTWNDPLDGYRQKPEYVEDRVGIARYGYRPADVVAVGCISRGQARRVGEWLLYSEQNETETVTFSCGHDSTYLRPGSVFAVQDQHRAGVRFGGRIVTATANSVTIDQAVTIASGQTYTVQVVLPDGTLATKALTNAPGSATVLTVSVNFAVTPVSPAVWMLTSTALSPRLFRTLSVVEVATNKYEVTGLAHNPSKFAVIDRDQPLSTPRYSTLIAVLHAPVNLVISESLSIRGGVVTVIVELSWDTVESASLYHVEYRRESGNYVSLADVRTTSAEIVGAIPGYYEVRVRAVSPLAFSSLAATASRQIYGKMLPPADVTGFVVARNAGQLYFSWRAVPDLDLDYYELRFGTVWESAVLLGVSIDTRYTTVSYVGGTVLIKAVDTSGNVSLHAAASVMDAYPDINIIVTANDAPTWGGVTVQTESNSTGVTLANTQRWNTLTNAWNTYTQTWAQMGTYADSGTYETLPIDLGQVMTSRVEIDPTVIQQEISGKTWASWTEPWSAYTDPWAGVLGKVTASYEMALSQNGSTWAAWQTYQAGHYLARAFKFRVTLTTSDPNYVPRLTSLAVTIDVPDRVLHFEDQATVAGGTTLTFSPAFVNVQTVTGTIQGGAVGDTFRVTGKTNSQATITVYDSTGAAKAGVVDIDVFGYGDI